MTDPIRPSGNSPLVAAGAILAAVLGVGLLGFGAVRLVGSMDGGAPATSQPSIVFTTSTTAAVATTDVIVTTQAHTFDPGEYVTVTDDTGAMSVSVPAEWTDRSGGTWTVDGEAVGLSIAAAIDRNAWYSGWDTPGVFIGLTTVGPDQFVPGFGDFAEACSLEETDTRDVGGYSIVYQRWVGCGDSASEFIEVLAWPESFLYSVLMQVVVLDRDGAEVVDEIVNTLSYAG